MPRVVDIQVEAEEPDVRLEPAHMRVQSSASKKMDVAAEVGKFVVEAEADEEAI